MVPDEYLTRQSLLLRLHDWADAKAWQDFFDRYWKLIHGAAMKAGLTSDEAQDVVQETLVTVARKIAEFEYDPQRGRFKGWLLKITRWRIADQFARRVPAPALPLGAEGDSHAIHSLPDPASSGLDAHWEAEWRKNLIDNALARVKPKISEQDYEIFDLHVMQDFPVADVAAKFGVTAQQIYWIKHKVTKMLAEQVKRLEEREY